MQMDCSDVVYMSAFIGRVKKEVGKGILMGLSGTKYTQKIILKRWLSIKVTSYTSNAAGAACPFLVG